MSDGTGSSRIENARRKSADAKRRLGVAAAATFAAALALGYLSHPGSTGASGAGSSATGDGGESARPVAGFDFGSGSIAPSVGSVPGAGTHVS